jgi:hypothetical protein
MNRRSLFDGGEVADGLKQGRLRLSKKPFREFATDEFAT